MRIQDMFLRDINRNINGVVKVGQEDGAAVEQELTEYVVTSELARHFADFYASYARALDEPTDKIGVWISGFFGSGKSHFLKMLSYLLSNRVVAGRPALDYFAGKFEDARTAELARRCAEVPTEAILFNIDNKGPAEKDRTAIMRIFARVFYENQGFFGKDLKLARLERRIAAEGKTEEFQSIYERINGKSWLEGREDYEFDSDDVVEALAEAGVMSEAEATRWIDGSEQVSLDIDSLTDEIAAYANARAEANGGQFRLLFMVDEVGQYIGADTSLMLNLQTIVEELGTKCAGRVWVMVTSQEAIDEVTTVVGNDFSKIQGRFTTRLSLSSSSADEVIKRRILAKTPEATQLLSLRYEETSAVLRNLFSFEGAAADLAGYEGAEDFAQTFPFVGYQFKLLQNVMAEIRKHSSSSQHFSSAERSMLSGFQEAAQRIEEKDERALVPFWTFYETFQVFLDGHIRRVINRAADAAAHGDQVLTPFDVSVLKLLFLLRWAKDVTATPANLVTLMTDSVDVDRAGLREDVQASLERLVHENYVGKSGEVYQFLTDDEQDIARQIARTQVDAPTLTKKMAELLFDDIFPTPKLAVGENNFPVEKWVDETRFGQTGGLVLRVLTALADEAATGRTAALMRSQQGEAIIVLSDETGYYDCLLEAARIDRFVATQNVSALPENQQRIIRDRNQEKTALEKRAKSFLEEAVLKGAFYAAGEEVRPSQSQSARHLIEDCVARLVDGTYPKLGLIDTNYHTDAEVRETLQGARRALEGQEPNGQALAEVDRFLDAQARLMLPTTMADIQRKFQDKPYGWRELDVAAVVAALVAQGKAKLRYLGKVVDHGSPKAVDLLRKRSETERAQVERRVLVSDATRQRAREAVLDFCRVNDLASEEDALAAGAVELLSNRRDELQRLLDTEYRGHDYPGRSEVVEALELVKEVLAAGTDPADLLPAIAKADDDLADVGEELQEVEGFFASQRDVFDSAAKLAKHLEGEREYLAGNDEALSALATIREVLGMPRPYRRIHELPEACQTLRQAYETLLAEKRDDMLSQIEQVYAQIEEDAKAKGVTLSLIAEKARARREQATGASSLLELDALPARLGQDQTTLSAAIDHEHDRLNRPAPAPAGATATVPGPAPAAPKKRVGKVTRTVACPPARFSSEADVDTYLKKVRARLVEALANNDEIQLS